MRNLLRTALILVLLLAWAAPLAGAHAYVERSTPADGETLMRAPQQMKIWFTEAIEAKLSSLKLVDASGKLVPGTSQSSQGDSVLVLNLPALEGGAYKVAWKVVSVDSHITNGTISFAVQGQSTPSTPAPANQTPGTAAPANQTPSTPAPANQAPGTSAPSNPATATPAASTPAPANNAVVPSPPGNQSAPESQKNDSLWIWGIAGLVLLAAITGITVTLRSRKA